MVDLKQDDELYQALRTLATGATQEEIGRDQSGTTKVFKRKLPPSFEAIKYLYDHMDMDNKGAEEPAPADDLSTWAEAMRSTK